MKKRVLIISLILLAILFLSPLAITAQDETEDIERAYSCLEDELGTNCGDSKSTEQSVLSLLAGAYDSGIQSDCKDSINNKKQDNCWGTTQTSNCDLKSTSQAILALNHIGGDIEDYINWLLEKKELATNLDWFLEIDANEATICKVNVNGEGELTFNIAEDKKISGTSTCLTPAEQNYFLKISDSCLEDNFTISCDKNFITTLLYKKTASSVYHVSSQTHSASADGTTQEKVNAFCFASTGSCDYEGSLWAAFALAKTGKDISDYLPYLSSMSDESENKKYFPSAFLHILTNEDDYYIDITEKQKQGKYWQEDLSNSKYYDTALALLSLGNLIVEEVGNAKDYLLEIQEESGCWNGDNIRDTSFILYAGWPKLPFSGGGGGSTSNCGDFGYYCVPSGQCSFSDTLDNFYCSALSEICCKTEPAEQSCDEKQGVTCDLDQECTGSEVIASDTNYCCLGSCITTSTTTECEDYGNLCQTTCSENQEEEFYECDYGYVCCGEILEDEEGGSWFFVILLIILIILMILAIIFRDQLKIWLFRFKSKLKFGKPPKPTGRPMIPPTTPPLQRLRPRQIIPRQPYRRPPARRPAPKKAGDSVFDETMKKLRDMSK